MALWNNSYETGNEIVDNDHKEIFALVEKVLSSSFTSRREKVATAVDFLANYTVSHFQNEEKLMDESDYPLTAEHKKQHADFLEVAMSLKQQFSDEGFSIGELTDDTDILHFSLEINKTVVGWLTEHVIGSDRNLANHYRLWLEKQGKPQGVPKKKGFFSRK